MHNPVPKDPWDMTTKEFANPPDRELPDRVRAGIPGWRVYFHVTDTRLVDDIVRHGLLTHHSKSPPTGSIWASLEPDGFYKSRGGDMVVFRAPEPFSDHWAAVRQPGDFVEIQGTDSVLIWRDVPPEDILLVDRIYRSEEASGRLSELRRSDYAEEIHASFVEGHEKQVNRVAVRHLRARRVSTQTRE